MSYILDALNKSEQQRGDRAQSAIVAPVNPAPPAKRRLALPAILLTTALLVAWGIVQINRDEEHPSSGSTSQVGPTTQTVPTAQIHPTSHISLTPQTAMAPPSTASQLKTSSTTPPAAPRQQPVASAQAQPIVPVQPPAPATLPHPVARTETSETSVRSQPKQIATQSEAVPIFKPITPTSSVSRMAAPSLDVPTPDVPTPDVPTGQKGQAQAAQAETDILAISELPLAVQQALPAIHIDGHIYDDNPAKRMVIINGKTYREKQQITGGLKLEEITPNGVILNFQGHVFHLGVFE